MTTAQKISYFIGFALLAGSFIVIITLFSQERIKANQHQAILNALSQVLPTDEYDNDLLTDTLQINSPLLGTNETQTLYRASKNGQYIAAVFTTVAPHGYNGAIKLLIGIRENGQITGVRAIAHQETPGLGDRMETQKSQWIYTFNNQSLQSLQDKEWAVKKDGGHFDEWTGATITPRAIVEAVHNALKYVEKNKKVIFNKNENTL